MKAALLYKSRDLRVEKTSPPCISDGEVLIRVKTAGLCGSDLHRYLGDRPVKYYPMILGHEFFGIVEKVGKDVQKFKAGDRVVANPFFTCGSCKFCLSGRRNLCRSRWNIGIDAPGCFAEFVKVPENALWLIPGHVPDQEAVMVEPTAVVLRAIKKSGNLLGKTVAVIGAGTMGQLVSNLAKSAGAEVIVSDVVEKKLEVCRQMGADQVINAVYDEPVAAVKRLTDGSGAEVVIETAGIPKTVEQAVKMAQPGGKVVLLGLATALASISPIDIARNELEVFGAVLYVEEFGEAVKLVSKRSIDFERIISHVLPLDKCREGFELMAGQQAMKILVSMD
ncbi:MAG: alcohol dehydrogenase catalytic domain-containing protein [Peptococcaceae bacterium]|nr:alcohol dehydrogenase catalytic domain-containing protein [Peptococcaceae bacterium]MDH7526266.1 alcohol dehydrogenase catalytic domain-containing protein [Peptococcaceae bacterium]